MTTEIATLDQKLSTLSEKYKLAKTSDMIKHIETLGFKMEKFIALKVRKKERQGFQKHRVIFTSDALGNSTDGIPQLLLTNSHDGSSSVILQLGFFRMVCSNGLVVGDNLIQPVRIRHTGDDFYDRLVAGINNVISQSSKLTTSIKKMKETILTEQEILEFQRKALQSRLGDDIKILDQTFTVHRREDESTDLFTVMNVVQENLIRGGARVKINNNGVVSDKAVRKVRGLQSMTDINTMLWNLAEQKVA